MNEWIDGSMDEWMNEGMDEWMGGRMNGWMNRWMDGWMDGCIDEWMNEGMDGWMNGWMDGWMDGGIDGWMDGLMNEWWMDEWMDGWMDGWMNGWMIGWKDEGMNESGYSNRSAYCLNKAVYMCAILYMFYQYQVMRHLWKNLLIIFFDTFKNHFSRHILLHIGWELFNSQVWRVYLLLPWLTKIR